MINYSKKSIVKRHFANPILSPVDMPFSCLGVFNSSVVRHDGRYYMVARAQGYHLISTFWLATSDDGYKWKVEGEIPLPDDPEYRKFARSQYDPRITRIGDIYYITACIHDLEARMGLFQTRDFRSFQWMGFMSAYGFRNTVLFPEKQSGNYASFWRPNSTGDIWYGESPDLLYWGNYRHVLSPGDRTVGVWGGQKIGPCGTPMRTDKGWLSVFHGVQYILDRTMIYHTGVFLTELDQPWEIIRVSHEPILSPEEPFELAGHAPNVVFASSQVVEEDGSVKLYYGAADKFQCVADTSIDLLLEAALER